MAEIPGTGTGTVDIVVSGLADSENPDEVPATSTASVIITGLAFGQRMPPPSANVRVAVTGSAVGSTGSFWTPVKPPQPNWV